MAQDEGSQNCGVCGGPIHEGEVTALCAGCSRPGHRVCLDSAPCVCRGAAAGLAAPGKPGGPHSAKDLSGASLVKRGRYTRDRSENTAWLLGLVGGLVTLAFLATLGWFVYRPQARAARGCQAAARLMSLGQVEQARSRLTQAARLDPTSAKAQLLLGLTYLGAGADGLDKDGLAALLESARWGRTEQLDTADRHFAQCVRIVQSGALARAPGSARAAHDLWVAANAHLGAACSALIRAGAAYDTGHSADGATWIAAARRSLTRADECGASGPAAELAKVADDLAEAGN